MNRPPGLRPATIGRAGGHPSTSSMPKSIPIFAGDGDQVQHAVGRATRGRHRGHGVLDGLERDDLRRPDVVAHAAA